ncbi:MAG: V-type ATP synthase subunit I [Ruminococcaceae bacterium]|nr:V-type ATP synthase subunit I [Oscillospiraceae bacterium]
MAILKMKKLSLIVPREDTSKVIKELMWLQCVEIIQQEPDGQLSAPPPDEGASYTVRRMDKLKTALDTIGKYRSKKGLFSAGEEITRNRFEDIGQKADEIYDSANKVLDVKDKTAKTKNEINTLYSYIYQLEPWKNHDLRLDTVHTASAEILRGTLPLSYPLEKLTELEDSDLFFAEQVSRDREQQYIVVYHLKKDIEKVNNILNSSGFAKTVFPVTDGTAVEISDRIEKRISALKTELEAMDSRLKELAAHAEDFEKLYDYENSHLNIYTTADHSLSTASTSVISGWIPEESVEKFKKALEKYTCYYELDDPSEDEKPPVELKNGKFASAFEGLIGLYSYPDYYGYDPLKYMSVFYCIIFGMMLADFVYGVLLTVGCLAAIKLMKPGKSMKAFLTMFAWSGVSTAIAGLLFGSIMGDLPSSFSTNMLGGPAINTAIWFDPTKNPMALLYVSFALGGIHLLWGMGLKAYMLFRNGKWVDAVCDIFTWYLLFAGIGVFAAGALLSIPIVFEAGKWMTILGVASIILTQGRAEKNIIMKLLKGIMGLYDIVNYVSDLLSYSRILALGLATAVVSSVINIMATLAGPSVIGFIMFVLILALGHALNIALNVLGSFVHASRLQYIEFFGKFYEDGGKHFSPLSVGAKYTRINTEEN